MKNLKVIGLHNAGTVAVEGVEDDRSIAELLEAKAKARRENIDLLHNLIDDGPHACGTSMASRPRTGTEGSHGSASPGPDPSDKPGMPAAQEPPAAAAQDQPEADEAYQQQPFVASTAPLTFTDFLEKMRAPAAMDLVRGIKSFISDMLKASSSSSSSDPEADGNKVQDFLSRSEQAFQHHPLWADSSYEELEAAGEGLEKYLLTKLYGRCFGVAAEDKERDELLNWRMGALQGFLKPEHLDIPEKYRNEQSWTLAQKELRKINTYKAPRDKLVCILNCCRVISNLLSVSAGEGAGADDFLPILIYVLILAAPPQLESNLAFIMRYRLASRLNGEAAYFYTNMVSATTFIETISPTSLSIDPQEFISHMKAAGVPGSEDRPRQGQDQASASAEAAEQAPVDQAPAEQARPPQDLPTPPQHQEEQQQQAFQAATVAQPPPPLPSLPPLSAVEERGSATLLEAEALGELHMRHRYLYTSTSDLKLRDVGDLLSEYKELALRYESLSRGYKLVCGQDLSVQQGESPPAPALVKAFHRTQAVQEGAGAGGDLIAMAALGSGEPLSLPEPPSLPTPPVTAPQGVQGSPLPDLLG